MPPRLQRPERYVPLSVHFHTGGTGTAIRKRFGRDGLLVWICYLTACKRHTPEGRISYASETEAWILLGLGNDHPDFTLDDFFTLTGRLKKTVRRRHGDVTETICTPWQRWTKAREQEDARERKARSRQQNNRDNDRDTSVTTIGQKRDLEVEREGELETPLNPPSRGGTQPSRSNGTNPRAHAAAEQAKLTQAQRQQVIHDFIARCHAEDWPTTSLIEELIERFHLEPHQATDLAEA